MFVTYQTLRSAMDVRQQPKNDIEEPSLASPASGKGLVGNLESRRTVVISIPQSVNDEEHTGMNTSLGGSLRGNTAKTEVPQSTTNQSKPQQPQPRGGQPPQSRGGLPLTKNSLVAPEPKLLHPFLLKISLHVRFCLNGFLSNIIFMFLYNWCVTLFEKTIPVTTIYAAVYLVYIPLNHFLVSILVFGWPEHYFGSLMNNFPIGLTAIALGSLLTGYLDRIRFSKLIDDFVFENLTFSKMPPLYTADNDGQIATKKTEFWSSLVVLVVTSIWTYVLSIFVNRSPTKSEKKEL